jgi:hypothetical protein
MKTWKQLITDAYIHKQSKNWNHLYWIVDLHDTVISGTYNKFNEGAIIYPYAKETLDYLYSHNVHQSILWTSSHDDAINDILKRFDIRFNYHHINPECPNTDICNFDRKLYFNFILDDKARFDPHNDWKEIYDSLIELDNKYKT